MFLWKIKFSLQQKEGSNDLVGPKYYVSPVGVPCCHCRMDKSFFKKALRYHTKKKFSGQNPQWEILFQKRMVESNQTKQETNVMPDYGRFECVALTNHLYSHSSRSVPSISYMQIGFLFVNDERNRFACTKCQMSLFFRRTGQAEYIRECQKYAKLQYTNASFNLKFDCLRMWVQSVTNFASKQNFLTYTLEERHSILLQPNLIFGQ